MWETKKKLQEDLNNAEQRVIFHWQRANEAEKIVNKAINTIKLEKSNKTPAVHILDKIEKILVNDYQSNN